MIIVAGQIDVRKGKADAFVRSSQHATEAARKAKGCHDFTVAVNPLDDDRVNVFERWEGVKDMLAFRGDGPDGDLSALIVRASVRRYNIRSSGPA